MDYLATIATEIGIPIFVLTLLVVWTAVWKLIALWKSARNAHLAWFIVLAIFNTAGILPIVYIFFFSKKKIVKKASKKVLKKKK